MARFSRQGGRVHEPLPPLLSPPKHSFSTGRCCEHEILCIRLQLARLLRSAFPTRHVRTQVADGRWMSPQAAAWARCLEAVGQAERALFEFQGATNVNGALVEVDVAPGQSGRKSLDTRRESRSPYSCTVGRACRPFRRQPPQAPTTLNQG